MTFSVFGVPRSAKPFFALRSSLSILAVAVGLAIGLSAPAFAQDTPAPKDDALDSLLKKLSEPSDRDRSEKKVEKPKPSKKDDQAGKKASNDSKSKPSGAKDDKSKGAKPGGSDSLSGKDQEVDELLQKLGETTDTPSP